jgi:hypothetical protein
MVHPAGASAKPRADPGSQAWPDGQASLATAAARTAPRKQLRTSATITRGHRVPAFPVLRTGGRSSERASDGVRRASRGKAHVA